MSFDAFVILICALGVLYGAGYFAYVRYVRRRQWQRSYDQVKRLKFLSVKIPKIAAKNSGDIEVTDHIQDMKQNIQLMNQIYKNFYALYNKKAKYGQDYISVELVIEKESIKCMLAVPDYFVETVEKMVPSFYPGSVLELVSEPKFLEAGKYVAGGEVVLDKASEFPIKTYEAFEADPMDSLLSAYSKVDVDEKLALQILIAPVEPDYVKAMRKRIDDIKEGKKTGWREDIKKVWKDLTTFAPKKDDDKKEKKNYDFSQQQLSDLDRKAEDELFDVRIRILATSPLEHRTDLIIDDVNRSLFQYNYVGLNSLVFKKPESLENFVKAFVLRSFFTTYGVQQSIKLYDQRQILNIRELSTILHFPNSKFNRNPRLRRQTFKIVPAPDNIPTEGIVLGTNIY